MKILVVHATAGAGHMKAAEAIYDNLRATGHEVIFCDVLDYTSKFYKRSYQKTYKFLVSKTPWLWGLLFWFLDVHFLLGLFQKFRRFMNALNAHRFVVFLKKKDFDHIVSTHFFPSEVAAYLKRKGLIKAKLTSVVTDYDVHSIWLANGIDNYMVATPFTKDKLKQFGIAEEKIFVTGIPTHRKFSQAVDRAQLCQKLGIENCFSVLVATGSFGFPIMEEVVCSLKHCQVLAVCGHNKKLYDRLKDKNLPRVKVYGLVDNMEELMSVVDTIITKPGGLSISESLVKGLPIIFFAPIPGQETNNIKVLSFYGIGIKGDDPKVMAQEVHRLATDASYLAEQKRKVLSLAHSDAAEKISHLVTKVP